MGANIGTSITNTFVALAQSGDREQFRRAFAGATVHDMFNWLTVMILLPLEVITGFLYRSSEAIVKSMQLDTVRGLEFDLLKTITSPLTSLVIQLDKMVMEQIALGNEAYQDEPIKKIWCAYSTVPGGNFTDLNSTLAFNNGTKLSRPMRIGTQKCTYLLNLLPIPDVYVGIILLVVSLALLCFCLVMLVKLLRSCMEASLARVIIKTINADLPGRASFLTPYLALLVGTIMTLLVQSSSVFTSALTPLAGVGAITMEKLYPLTLGSNIGTTVTGILAALAAPGDKLPIALQIALCHLLFNLSGTALFFPVPILRKVPIELARFLGRKTATYRWFAVLYIIVVFFLVPAGVCFLSIVGGPVALYAVLLPTAFLILLAILINFLQSRHPRFLPYVLRTWDFLPLWMHSLRPLDNVISKFMCCQFCKHANQTDELEAEEAKQGPLLNTTPWPSSSTIATVSSSKCLLQSSTPTNTPL